jgi:alcohol dehydrogenase
VLGIVRHPGAFRELLTLPEVNLHVVPDSITTEEAVFVEPLAAAGEILDQVQIPDGSDVALLGDGKLGLLIAQSLNARGKRVHLYGRHKDKLRIAARASVNTIVVGKKLPQSAYDWVVDATGSSDGLGQAIGMTRPRGTIFMKSTIHGTTPIDAAPVIVNELTLVGSRCGRFEPAIELLQSRKVNVEDMICDILPLEDAPRAFARAAKRGVLKILLDAR